MSITSLPVGVVFKGDSVTGLTVSRTSAHHSNCSY